MWPRHPKIFGVAYSVLLTSTTKNEDCDILYIFIYYITRVLAQASCNLKVGLKTQFPSSTDSVVFAKYQAASLILPKA